LSSPLRAQCELTLPCYGLLWRRVKRDAQSAISTAGALHYSLRFTLPVSVRALTGARDALGSVPQAAVSIARFTEIVKLTTVR
jgi:hypothetical protein